MPTIPKQLEPYLPTGSGHVIITSRNQAWTHSAEPLEVDVFTRDESVGHLLRHVPELDVADAKRVADALGHLPLAVEQASAWLEQTGMPAQVYVEQLATQSPGSWPSISPRTTRCRSWRRGISPSSG